MSGQKDEFARIRDFFRPLARGHPAALDMQDDAALLNMPAAAQLVVSADMLAESVHFRSQDALDLVARKSLRVNLSDLAAKGAAPLGYFLCLCWPRRRPQADMQSFADGLAQDGRLFDIPLLGGDLIAADGRLTIAVTVLGSIAGAMPRRTGGKPGDDLYVSGTLGDSALGLQLLQGKQCDCSQENRDRLQQRYLLPTPRLALGQALAPLIGAGMDISDGLLADLQHICAASGTGALVVEADLPLSPAARAMTEADATLRQHIFAGDDYELLFSASPERREAIAALARRHDTALTRIGCLTAETGIRLQDPAGHCHPIANPAGYRHF